MKTIKAKVHMLPTEDKTYIGVAFNGLHYMSDVLHRHHISQYQHLYITTDEEIKEGDWVIQQFEGQDADVCQITYGEYEIAPDIQRKIIATTDPNISKIGYQSGKLYGVPDIEGTKFEDTRLPVMPQSFIEEYCKAGGIDEVLVEYIDVMPQLNGTRTDGKIIDEISLEPSLNTLSVPKLNSDNTIIIHPVEEKMYSRSEENL